MYHGVRDSDNRMLLVDLKNNNKERPHYSGIFEKHILCGACENKLLGELDQYAYNFLFKDSKIKMNKKRTEDGLRMIEIENINYTKYKLFLLSIVWRSHISKHSFFKGFDIGAHSEALRKMILFNSPGPDTDYKISVMGIKDASDELLRVVVNPQIRPFDNGHLATFFISGFIYFIALGEIEFKSFELSLLKENGNINIPIVDKKQGSRMIQALGLPDYIAQAFYEE
jgi:hypothetical protein